MRVGTNKFNFLRREIYLFNHENFMTLEKISDNMPGALLVYKDNAEEEVIYASEDIARLFECDSTQDFMRFTGGSFSTIVHPEDIEEVDQIIQSQIRASGGYDYVTYRIITKSGAIKKIEDWGRLIEDPELGRLFYVYLNDMTIREKLVKLSGQAPLPEPKANIIDNLTGLTNMKYFRQEAPNLIKNLQKKGGTPKCIYLNIRNFRTYNEAYGFSGGDRMLKSISRILLDTFPRDLVSRFDDDHFVVLTTQDNLAEKIERLSVRVSNMRHGVIVELKAGIYEITNPNMDISIICDCAKMACDSIKREFGTLVKFYDGNMDKNLHLQEHILNSFSDALKTNKIKVYLQPVVDVSTGEIDSVEAFTRWEDPEYGRLSPANYLYILEESYLIHKLDSFVIEKVCEELKRQKDNGEKLIPVSLNLSRLDFELTDIVRVIEDSIAKNHLPRELLRFELTESMIAVDVEAMKHETDRLREHGFKVWMDAFGAGYSSLSVLKDFNLDGLKIDIDMLKSFDDKRGNIIISTIIQMAKRLGIPALSKGVETSEQLKFLKSAGCDLAQGFYFGRPEPMKED